MPKAFHGNPVVWVSSIDAAHVKLLVILEHCIAIYTNWACKTPILTAKVLQAEQQLAGAETLCQDLKARTEQAEAAAQKLRLQAAQASQLRHQMPLLQQLASLQVQCLRQMHGITLT